ncbi:hypothetical protein Tcan_03723 [Toxocara canis]|uniref:Uncharacterized protein n=1 Tax=Toxocara canis TaxID=6265 RepID=A0A0B2V7C2_TOXCA|nr:hypothetical protein Tcan_03723 [Toxocara canis]
MWGSALAPKDDLEVGTVARRRYEENFHLNSIFCAIETMGLTSLSARPLPPSRIHETMRATSTPEEASTDPSPEVVIGTVDEWKDRKQASTSRSFSDSSELLQEVERFRHVRRYKRRQSEDVRDLSSEVRRMMTEAGEQGEMDLPDLESLSNEEETQRKRKRHSRHASRLRTPRLVKDKAVGEQGSFAKVGGAEMLKGALTKPSLFGLSLVESILAPSLKNPLNGMMRHVAQSKAEMSAEFRPETITLLFSDFLFQKAAKAVSPLKRSGSSDSRRSRSASSNRSAIKSKTPSEASSPTRSGAVSGANVAVDMNGEGRLSRSLTRPVSRRQVFKRRY